MTHADGLFLDFNGGDILRFAVNGKTVDPDAVKDSWKENKIYLDTSLIKDTETNKIEFTVCNRFNNDQFGFVIGHDPDGGRYVYIQTVPYYASRILPMFDQPDIKGTYEISVLHSDKDICVTTGPLIKTENLETAFASESKDWSVEQAKAMVTTTEGASISHFEKTPLLSSYLLNLVCGPLVSIDATPEQQYNGIAMKIMCRSNQKLTLESLATYAQAEKDNIFQFQQKGLEWYERFFKCAYPFKKLDSIFCPDFAWGAMEYPGAVTYNENLLPQRANNSLDVTKRGHVFLHEISHMWFGNLVTMKWWNGLWLNESFAEFICNKCFDSVYQQFDFKTSIPWVNFMASKFKGYREDQLPSTHPIAGEVENTEVACSIFDGITYQKGSSVLKQLMCIVGEDTFSAALESYFNTHAYKNTSLDDLLAEFDAQLKKQEHPRVDIMQWKEDWLMRPGLNSIEFKIQEATGKATIVQKACMVAHPTLRNHFIKVAFFDESCNLIGAQELTTSKTGVDEISLDGVSHYKAVLPNHDVIFFHLRI